MISQLSSKLRSLWRHWRGGSPKTSPQVEFYTREGCCLCDDALELLKVAQRRYPFQLQIIDVDQSPDLQAKYGSKVPVVLVNGRERFHGRINPVLLNRLLSAEVDQG
jgi:glutaredoxin